MSKKNHVGPQINVKKETSVWIVAISLLLVIVVAFSLGTQFVASKLNYHPALGGNFYGFYWPWSLLIWASEWGEHYPNLLRQAWGLVIVVAAAGMIALALWRIVSSNSSRAAENLHGSARWAKKKDILASGLLPKDDKSDGVYVGGWVDPSGVFHYLRHNGPEHVLTYAPTRSGKGVGLVIPTLLSWKSSAVVTDLKGELWSLTAGWRHKHANNKTLRFEPASTLGSVRWNPLDEIRLGTEHETGDIQNLTTLIVDPDGKGLESHWQKTAFALLAGVIAHALYKREHEGTLATLSSVDEMLADPNRDIEELWVEMATYTHVDGEPHRLSAAAARDMMDRPEEEAGSVLSTAKSYLSLYRDPVVAENTATSEFKIRDLMNHDDPVSLYIVTQPTDKDRLKPLVRVLVNMIVRLLADGMTFEDGRPVANYKHRLLMMLDEFPALGKLDILQEALAYVAGYGIKCYLICQDINQLKSREKGYGPDETVTSNCHVQNAYPPNRVETAEHLSKLSGQTTVSKTQITVSGRRASAMLGQVSKTTQDVARPLLTPDECLRMPGPKKGGKDEIVEAGDMVVYVAGYPAIYGKQPLYFKDPVFTARSKVKAPERSDKLRHPQSANGVIEL